MAGGNAWLSVKMFADTKQYQKGMMKAKGMTSKFASSIKSLLGAAGVVGVSAGLAAIGRGAIKSAANMEVLRTSFKAMTGSVEEANKVMETLTDFTAKTPFQLDEVAGASRQLLAAGVATKELTGELKLLGDLAAVTNVPITEMAQIYSKAMNKGKLQAEELNQLSERGIPIMKELASMYGVTKNEIFDMASKGKIGFTDLQRAMQRMTSEGGIAFNAMEELSKTSQGLYSTFKDNLNLTLAELGDKVLPLVNKGLDTMNRLMSDSGIHGHIASLEAEKRAAKEMQQIQRKRIAYFEDMVGGSGRATKATQELLRWQLVEARAQQELNILMRTGSETTEEQTTEIDDQTKAVEKLEKAVAKLNKTVSAPSQAPSMMGAGGLELINEIDDTVLQDVQYQIRKTNEETQAWATNLGIAGDGIGALGNLYAGALGDEAANRKAIASFQAALAVPQAFLTGLVQGGPGLGAAYGAIAALQAAAIASTPMPSFAIGTTSFRGGPAILHPGETISNLPQGTKVLSKGMSNGGQVVALDTKFDGRDLYLVQDKAKKVQDFFRP